MLVRFVHLCPTRSTLTGIRDPENHYINRQKKVTTHPPSEKTVGRSGVLLRCYVVFCSGPFRSPSRRPVSTTTLRYVPTPLPQSPDVPSPSGVDGSSVLTGGRVSRYSKRWGLGPSEEGREEGQVTVLDKDQVSQRVPNFPGNSEDLHSISPDTFLSDLVRRVRNSYLPPLES